MSGTIHSCIASVPICAQKRVPLDRLIPVIGPNWTGGIYRIEVRPLPGGAGSPLITLTNAAAGTQGISATYDAAYALPDGSGTSPATVFRIRIDEVNLEALALASPAQNAVTLYYDFHVTPVAGDKFALCGGVFSIEPGVTI